MVAGQLLPERLYLLVQVLELANRLPHAIHDHEHKHDDEDQRDQADENSEQSECGGGFAHAIHPLLRFGGMILEKTRKRTAGNHTFLVGPEKSN